MHHSRLEQVTFLVRKGTPRVKRALIVDDNATNRSVLAYQLQRLGIETVAVTSGLEALSNALTAHADGRPFEYGGYDASAEYRRKMLPLLVRRALDQLASA